jgi:hypothetical protein
MTHSIKDGTYKLHKYGMGGSVYFYPKGSVSGREVYYSASPLHLKQAWSEIRKER